MRKVLFLLLSAFILLVGCSNGDKEERDMPKVISENEHNLTLIDNDDLKMKLLKSTHERTKEADTVKLRIEIQNKRNKTFEYNFMTLQLDGDRDVGIGLDTHEVKPNESLQVDLYGVETKELEFKEYIGGEFRYNDYEGDGPDNKETFSEYIN